MSNKMKSVTKKFIPISQSEGVGATVKRSIGSSQLRNLDPFLMFDDFTVQPPAGFPDHPHRGFETVTYMMEGHMNHEDFAGHKGSIGPGDLQWMTAGRGIVHAEIPASEGVAKGFQLWVNLPKEAKMMEPKYQELVSDRVPTASSSNGNVNVKVIAGESMGVSSSVSTHTPIFYLDVNMNPNETWSQSLPHSYSGFIYTLQGSAKFGSNQEKADERTALVLSKEGDSISITTEISSCRFLILAGQPLNEPIVQHGPFVMNTREEIMQAILDYQTASNGFERSTNWKSKISQGFF